MANIVVAFGCLLFLQCKAQSVRTVNGSLLFEIGGASLTLSGGGSPSSGGSFTLASQSDVNSAIQTSVQQTQPQVFNVDFYFALLIVVFPSIVSLVCFLLTSRSTICLVSLIRPTHVFRRSSSPALRLSRDEQSALKTALQPRCLWIALGPSLLNVILQPLLLV